MITLAKKTRFRNHSCSCLFTFTSNEFPQIISLFKSKNEARIVINNIQLLHFRI